MLTKLIKYEWKAVWRVLAIINAFTVIVTILGVITMNLIVTDSPAITDDTLDILTLLMFLLYYATIIGVSFAVIIYSGMRFYKNLYTDEGYLMHTLPVKKWQLIVSKLTVHTLSVALTQLLVLLSVIMLMIPLLSVLARDPNISLSTLYAEVMKHFAHKLLSVPTISLLLFAILVTFIGFICSILTLYCAISLGQTFFKHKLMGSILCYIGLYLLMQIVNTVLMLPQMISSLAVSATELNLDLIAYMYSCLTPYAISNVLCSIAFYGITFYIMKKNLNLD